MEEQETDNPTDQLRALFDKQSRRTSASSTEQMVAGLARYYVDHYLKADSTSRQSDGRTRIHDLVTALAGGHASTN